MAKIESSYTKRIFHTYPRISLRQFHYLIVQLRTIHFTIFLCILKIYQHSTFHIYKLYKLIINIMTVFCLFVFLALQLTVVVFFTAR